MQISFNQRRETRRSLRRPWNPVTTAPAVFGGLSHTCQLVCLTGRARCYLVTRPQCAQAHQTLAWRTASLTDRGEPAHCAEGWPPHSRRVSQRHTQHNLEVAQSTKHNKPDVQGRRDGGRDPMPIMFCFCTSADSDYFHLLEKGPGCREQSSRITSSHKKYFLSHFSVRHTPS